MSESNLKLYSLGIVVETKPEGTDTILVTPIETLNIQAPGSIKNYKKDYKGDKKELESTSFKTEHEAKNYIRATWLPFGHSNRITAPDVNANETVVLFKFGDVDEIYWTTIFREPTLRRLEDVLYSYSNLPKGMTAFDKDSSYWARFSTKGKLVQLHTSMNDGEHTTYDITIDTKTGTLEVKDGKKNSILLHSPSNTLTINTQNAVNVNAENEVNVTTKTAVVTASSHTTVKSPTIDLVGDVNVSGKFLVKGPTTLQAGLSVTKGGSVSGNLSVSGDLNATGKIMDTGGNSNHHSH